MELKNGKALLEEWIKQLEVEERIAYWEKMLGKYIDCRTLYTAEEVDKYVKETIADSLKKPEVIARILGKK